MNIINRFPEANKKCVYSISVSITYAPEKYAFINKHNITRAEVREIIRKYRDKYAEIKVSAYYIDDMFSNRYEYEDYIVITNYVYNALRDKDARSDAKTTTLKYHSSYETYREQFLNDAMLFYADRTGKYSI